MTAPLAGFEPLDAALGATLARLARENGDDDRAVALAAAVASAARRAGHACVDLAAAAGRTPRELGLGDGDARLPALAEWTRALERSALCGDGSAATPLVLATGRLWLGRAFAAERGLAAALRARCRPVPGALDAPGTTELLGALFPPADGIDWQRVAAFAGLRQRLCVVSGGPGTGKTTTVVRLLALLLHAQPGARVLLAAPTGKAAARLGEAIRAQLDALPVAPALRAAIPAEALTVHRLLGMSAEHGGLRFDRERPLACDALVVDEASMLDLELTAALAGALPAAARLVLIGDPHQLASVDAGYVLGDLCAAAGDPGAFGAGFAADHEACTGVALPVAADATPLHDAVVELRRNFRFEHQRGIAALAAAVRRGDGDAAAVAIAEAAGDVTRRDRPADAAAALEPLADALERYRAADSPVAALAALATFRVLCAPRRGPFGVRAFNEAVERRLALHERPGGRHYRGRPVLVERNDRHVHLTNGDVGVCWPDADGRTLAWFDDPSRPGALRAVPVARLPEHDTAFAMTVHKSQGSEFADVLLALPDFGSPLGTREWLYTGITRARSRVVLLGDEAALRQACGRPAHRWTTLRERLTRTD